MGEVVRIAHHRPGSRIELLPMRRKHLPSVLRIESKVYPKAWSVGIFLSELSLQDSRFYYVSVEDRKVTGYCGLMVVLDEGHITNIAVEPSFQGSGIATRLLLNAFQLALSHGVKDMTLEVRASNKRAQQLYYRFGFEPVGVRRGYYVDNGEDAIIMWSYGIDSNDQQERIAAIRASLELHDGQSGGKSAS